MLIHKQCTYINSKQSVNLVSSNRGEIRMVQKFEYMIVYLTPHGKRAGLYRGMNKKELDSILDSLRKEGCKIEKVEIVRIAGV